MTLDFDGNMFQPFVIHDDWEIDGYVEIPEKESFPLGDELWYKIENWRTEYAPFTSMTLDELEPNLIKTDELDTKAIALLKEIASKTFLIDNRITRLRYFSLCRNKFIFEINK